MLREELVIQEADPTPALIHADADGPGDDDASRHEQDLSAISVMESLTQIPILDLSTGGVADTSMMMHDPTERSGSDASNSATSLMNRNQSVRRTGSQIASLRAAFEQKDTKATGDTPMKRFERFPVRTYSARAPDTEMDALRLKEQLREANARCVALEEKVRRSEEAAGEGRRYHDRCVKLEKDVEDLELQLQQQDGLGGGSGSTTSGSISAKSQEEASLAMRQLQDLKRSISTATWTGNQVTDSTFAQETQHLHHEVQNWVVNNFRRTKLNKTPAELCARLESVSEPGQMDRLRPVFESYHSGVKLVAIQAVVVSYLIEIFEEPLLFGLPSQGDWRRYLRKTTETLPSVLDPGTFNRWRSFTLDLVKKSGRIQESVESASRSMSEVICLVLSALTDAMPEDLETRVPSLNTIVKRAITLSHLYRVQRARYEFHLPLPGSHFSAESMEDCSADGDQTVESTVKCATFPYVVKIGDDNGDNPDLSNIIVKAKVFRDC
ncbi:unnamed protein product [Zymoseptoria tritici ST99CH_1A5]|uniref:Uncharacterized protein n=2 Tax=Zymoseptoria tritici TaxID=1047171 RepID=A0A1X7RFM4_ZYMT9|nr:unnamed protein product [Zymoseptoria tritici ST99CH_3D7]SMR44736.1 unnamed protein product [Zymoseptoria tritici ST99CH_3D1]SMY19901.1 unnamed protein product [Zymoseptoria tritici ST99CH_1A5]